MVSRRHFLKAAAAVTVGFAGLQRHTLWAAPSSVEYGYGPLVPDPEGIFDLPKGFSYQIISRMGDAMDDGLLLPGEPDAMATFAGPNNRTLLVRNHELTAGAKKWVPLVKTTSGLTKYPEENSTTGAVEPILPWVEPQPLLSARRVRSSASS